MDLKLLKCDWGMEHLGDQAERLRAFADAGYDGVECAMIQMDPKEFADRCERLGLDYVAMMFCDDEEAFRKQLRWVRRARPILINCHPGRDHFDFERGLDFFRAAMDMAGEAECQVVFETHRTRILYAPWTTARYIEALPELRICADLSHFTVVAENDLEAPEYAALVSAAIERADHIHARVGFEQAPQVPDPRVGPGLVWTKRFEGWWDRIIEARLAESRPFLTINPEFGPIPYQPFDPQTLEPLADIWDVCLWMTGRFRERWSGRLGASH